MWSTVVQNAAFMAPKGYVNRALTELWGDAQDWAAIVTRFPTELANLYHPRLDNSSRRKKSKVSYLSEI